MTKAYFKWDGRNGITSIIGITSIQWILIIDIALFILRLFFERNELLPYLNTQKWMALILYIIILLYNFNRYKNTYNKMRSHWKNEDRKTRIIKGILVVISLALPWAPLILMGVYWK